MMKLLLIEDDTHIAREIQYFLEMEKFDVRIADTVSKALKLLKQDDYQLILLDVSLPDGDGFALFDRIKAIRDMPVVFLTALDEEENVVKGFDLGADEYITKPFRPRELLSRIKNVIRHAGIESDAKKELQIGDVRIHPEQAVVYKKNEKLELTALEYKLLVLLFENKGRILTRTQILANIWDESEHFVNDNTLTVYIKRLREQIEENPNQPKIIQTVRGMGYRTGV